MTALRTSRAIGNDKRADRRTGRIWQFDSSHHAITSGWSATRKLARNGDLGNWPIARRFRWSSTAGHTQHRREPKLHLLSFARKERSRRCQACTGRPLAAFTPMKSRRSHLKGQEADRQACLESTPTMLVGALRTGLRSEARNASGTYDVRTLC